MDLPGSTGQIIFLIICLGLSAFFSASETAFSSIGKIKLRNLVEDGVKGAATVAKLLENQNKLLSTILVGNNFVNITASALATSIALQVSNNHPLAIMLATILLTLVILLVGEITPKTVATKNSEKICLAVGGILNPLVWLASPLVNVLSKASGLLSRLVGLNNMAGSPSITEADLKTIVTVSHEEGVLETDEREMINNVVDFGDYAAEDVMTPRTDMATVPIDATYDEVMKVFEEERFTRLPVYRDSTDNIVGIVHIKDIAFAWENKQMFSLENYLREAHFTYESKPTSQLFAYMRNKRIPMVIVLDEYGGTAGLVTMEDLIEEIVGDISDEYDDDQEEIQKLSQGEYLVDGGTKITDVNETVGSELESEDFDSIGGYVLGLLAHIPEPGETVGDGNYTFIVEAIDKNRITALRMVQNAISIINEDTPAEDKETLEA